MAGTDGGAGGRHLRLRLPAALQRRARRPGRPVRPAQRHARPPAADGRRHPATDAHRPARRSGQLRRHARAGAAQLLPDHEQQRPARDPLDRRDGLAVASAVGGQPGAPARPGHPVVPDAVAGFPRQLGRSATGGRGRPDRRRGPFGGEGRQGVRPGAPRAGAGHPGGGGPVRLPDAGGTAPGPLPARAPSDPWPRPGRHPGPRRMDGAAPPDQPGHLPRLLDLRRPAGRTGATPRQPDDHRPAGPGRCREDLPASRPGARDRRRTRRRRAARAPGRRRVPRRDIRLRRRWRGRLGRLQPGGPGRPAGRSRRSERVGQVQRRLSPGTIRRPADRSGPRGRPRPAGRDPRVVAAPDRCCLRGQLPVLRVRAGQHLLQPAWTTGASSKTASTTS